MLELCVWQHCDRSKSVHIPPITNALCNQYLRKEHTFLQTYNHFDSFNSITLNSPGSLQLKSKKCNPFQGKLKREGQENNIYSRLDKQNK